MNIPANLRYTKSHEWVEIAGTGAKVGLTDHAQQSMGSFVYVNLPEVGDTLQKGDSLGDVESVKAVSEVYAPVSGTVSAVNGALADEPGKINEDPYGAWLVELENIGDTGELLDAAAYEEVCKEEE